MSTIVRVSGTEILDSRGNPTVEALELRLTPWRGSISSTLLGKRIVLLAALDVAAFLHEVADPVGRDRLLALRANIECRRDQEVVAATIAFG